VQITAANVATVTDVFGGFILKDLPAGTHTLSITYLGFETLTQSFEIQDNESKELKLQLKSGGLQLNEVTVSAGDKRNLNAVNSVDIGLRPVNSSQDILRVVPGLFMAQHAGGGKAEQIFLRGFDIDHGTDINLQVDGMPVNMVSHAHGQGYSDLHFVIPELVGVVGFEKGPYYANKGDFTTAGYVDFQTKNALDKSMLKVEGGQFGTFRTVATLDLLGNTAKERGQSAYIAGEFLNSRGYFDSPQAFKRLNLFAKYQHQLDRRKILTLSLAAFRSSWDASGQIPERAVQDGTIGRFGAIDDTEGGQTDRSSFNAKLLQALPDGSVLSNQVYFINYNFELYSNFTFFLNDPVNGDQIRQKEARNIFGYTGSLTKEMNLGKTNLTSEIGLGIRYDEVRDNELTSTRGRKESITHLAFGDVNELNVNGYLSETFRFNDKFTLNAGLRLDYFQFEYTDKLNPSYVHQIENQTILSPKLNLTYDVNNRVRLYAKVGYGFHSNDARVVVAQNAREILPKALGFDLGMIVKPTPALILQAAVWTLNLEQEFVYVGDAGIVEPSGKTRRQGIDVSIRYQITDWLYADADLNLTRPTALDVPEEENNIPLAPTFTGIGGLSWRMKNGLNGSLRYRYLDDRPANEDNSLTAEGYFLIDAVVKYSRPKYEIGISVENILNRAWKEAQFDTESRLANEASAVSEIHFTPGSPFFLRASVAYFF
jgi:outer membrane receptor protein involved in Fe transport